MKFPTLKCNFSLLLSVHHSELSVESTYPHAVWLQVSRLEHHSRLHHRLLLLYVDPHIHGLQTGVDPWFSQTGLWIKKKPQNNKTISHVFNLLASFKPLIIGLFPTEAGCVSETREDHPRRPYWQSQHGRRITERHEHLCVLVNSSLIKPQFQVICDWTPTWPVIMTVLLVVMLNTSDGFFTADWWKVECCYIWGSKIAIAKSLLCVSQTCITCTVHSSVIWLFCHVILVCCMLCGLF